MTDRELDAEVAEKVMEWTRYPEAMHATDNRTINGVLYCRPEFPNTNFGGALNVVPDYSTDMSAAMQVIEEMREAGWSFACRLYEGRLPYASFCKLPAASSRNAEAESLPRAICEAALKAVETTKVSEVRA